MKVDNLPLGTLTVTVHSAALEPRGHSGAVDSPHVLHSPYVRAHLEHYDCTLPAATHPCDQSTAVAEKTNDPVWGTEHALECWSLSQPRLFMHAFSHDNAFGRDAFLGECVVGREDLIGLVAQAGQESGRLSRQLGPLTARHEAAWTWRGEVSGSLSFSCRFAFAPLELGVVQVVVKRAEDLLAADSSGTSDPYCMVRVEQTSVPAVARRTDTQPKTLDPVWDHQDSTFDYDISSLDAVLYIDVYDENAVGSPDFLGEARDPSWKIMRA